MNEDTLSVASDSLSTALRRMRLRALVAVALDAGGDWAVDFPAFEGFTLNVIEKGECWLAVEGDSEKVRLRAGDCFLLTGGRGFALARDLSSGRRLRAESLFARAQDGVATCGGGGDFFVAGTIFRFEGHLPGIVFGRLPPVIRVAGDSDAASALRWSFERFGDELRGTSVGRSLVLNHLAPIMLLLMLRIYLASAGDEENWLAALSDSRLAKALDAMHSDFARDWSLGEFARLASMSRSGFAHTFKKTVGLAPMEYLMNWRMQVACDLLREGDESLSAIALAVGYGSESAFSVAFDKIVKCRPGAYRKRLARRP